MRATSLGAFALLLAAGMVGLTSCSEHTFNSSNDPGQPGPTQPGPTPAESNGPHLYVAATSNGNSSTYGFSVSTDGQLTAITGFPLS